MGKKIDALLGRSFKASKFKALLSLANSRLGVLQKQRQARCSLARSDVIQLLNLGQHERALIRVEQVLKERNMLDVFGMIEGYCVLLSERIKVIELDKACPDELQEATSSLIFAASRCGEFPELQEMRTIFATRYGKEFASRAVELRNNCRVNPKMIQKLSTKQPSLESRLKALKEIADENGIVLQLQEQGSITVEEKVNIENQPVPMQSYKSDTASLRDQLQNLPEDMNHVGKFADSMNKRKQYKDVADAAHEAFMSAAYAAAAARAAVELSRSYPQGPDDYDNGKDPRKQNFSSDSKVITEPETIERGNSEVTSGTLQALDKSHNIDQYSLDSDDEETNRKTEPRDSMKMKKENLRKDSSVMSSGVFGKDKPHMQEAVFDESDVEIGSEKPSSDGDKNPWAERGIKLPRVSHKHTTVGFQDGSRIDHMAYSSAGLAASPPRLNLERKPISLRTRR